MSGQSTCAHVRVSVRGPTLARAAAVVKRGLAAGSPTYLGVPLRGCRVCAAKRVGAMLDYLDGKALGELVRRASAEEPGTAEASLQLEYRMAPMRGVRIRWHAHPVTREGAKFLFRSPRDTDRLVRRDLVYIAVDAKYKPTKVGHSSEAIDQRYSPSKAEKIGAKRFWVGLIELADPVRQTGKGIVLDVERLIARYLRKKANEPTPADLSANPTTIIEAAGNIELRDALPRGILRNLNQPVATDIVLTRGQQLEREWLHDRSAT